MFLEDDIRCRLYAYFVKEEWLIYAFDRNDPEWVEGEYLFKLTKEGRLQSS
jgi:hypothetical protein